VRVKVVVERFSSNPGMTFEARQAVEKALRTLAEWLEQGGLGEAKVDLANVDLELPMTMTGAGAATAHLVIAEKIAVHLRGAMSTSGGGDPVVVEAGGSVNGGGLVETIRSAGTHKGNFGYFNQELFARTSNKKNLNLSDAGLGPKVEQREAIDQELVTASWDQLSRALRSAQYDLLSTKGQRAREGYPTRAELASESARATELAKALAPLVVEHLKKIGVAAQVDPNDGAFVLITPENGGSKLNKIAASLQHNQGVALKVDCKSKIEEPRELGYYQWRTKTLVMDFEEGVASGKVSDTMLHEVVHSYQALLRESGLDPTTSLEAHVTRGYGQLPSGMDMYHQRFGVAFQDFYSTFMSTEELLTFSRDLRNAAAPELRGEVPRTLTAQLASSLRSQARMLVSICSNVIGVAERMKPRLKTTAATGKEEGEEFSVGEQKDGFTGKRYESADLGKGTFPWRVQELAQGGGLDDLKAISDREGKSGVGKLFSSGAEAREAKMRIAARILEKLEVLHEAALLIVRIAGVLYSEVAKLEAGRDVLTVQGVHTLRGLTGWPGYIARLANAPELSMAERLAAVRDQKRRVDAALGPAA
jgi:hypothetical protein